MLLVTQRVRTAGGQEGINAFHYSHGGFVWYGLPPPELLRPEAAVLVRDSIEIPPHGNAVRSYLDVTAPDDIPWEELRQALFVFIGYAQTQPFPWEGVAARCYFRIAMDRRLAADWRSELAQLYQAFNRVADPQLQ